MWYLVSKLLIGGGKGVRKVGGQIEKGSSQIKNFKADSLPKILRLENQGIDSM